MIIVLMEILQTKKNEAKWITDDEEYSYDILNTCDDGLKALFRAVEGNLLDLMTLT